MENECLSPIARPRLELFVLTIRRNLGIVGGVRSVVGIHKYPIWAYLHRPA